MCAVNVYQQLIEIVVGATANEQQADTSEPYSTVCRVQSNAMVVQGMTLQSQLILDHICQELHNVDREVV